MNTIMNALRHIRYTIPERLLSQAFLSNRYYHNLSPRSVESVIEQVVIDGRVRPDISMNTGVEFTIPLSTVPYKLIDNWNKVYMVPKELTQGRSITSVLSVGYGINNMVAPNAMPVLGGSQPAGAANSVVNGVSNVQIASSAQAWMIGENVVAVRDLYNSSPYVFLRCWVDFDKELSNINPRSHHEFFKLVELATKAKIYNDLVLEQDYAFIHAGQELGVLRDLLNSYSGANEEYQTFLHTDWRKVALMNDPEQHRRFIGHIFPPLI